MCDHVMGPSGMCIYKYGGVSCMPGFCVLLPHPGCMLCNSGMTHLWHTFCSPSQALTLCHTRAYSCVGGEQLGIISRTNFLSCKLCHALTCVCFTPCYVTLAAKQSEWALKLLWNISQREGPRTLLRGLGPRLIAVPSYMSVFYVVNEELEWHLLNKRLTN